MLNFAKTNALILIAFLTAFILRALQVGNGLPYLYYWDEPQTVAYAIGLLRTGTLNPQFYSYGSLPMYMSATVDALYYGIRHALPVSSPYYMESIQEVKLAVDTGWYWDFSHPGFVYWNRMLTACMSAGMVAFTFLIVQRLFQHKWLAFAAALFLAVIPFHVEQGIRTTPDTPAAFFVMMCTYFALRYKQALAERDLIISLIAMGCAVAVKYNSGLVGLMPLSAFLMHWHARGTTPSLRQFAIVFLVPPLTFMLAMPYAVLEMGQFIEAMLREFNHYSVAGHGAFTSEPGIPHILFQLRTIHANLGTLTCVIILLGFGAVYSKRSIAFILIYPIIFFLFMTSMKVNFHRNFVQLYPFLAILFACGLFTLVKLLRHLLSQVAPHRQSFVSLPVIILAVLLLAQKNIFIWPNAWAVAMSTDSRSDVIDELNTRPIDTPLYLARELHFQLSDLKRLKHAYEIVDAVSLSACHSRESKQALFVLPTYLAYLRQDISGTLNNLRSQRKRDARLQQHAAALKAVESYQMLMGKTHTQSEPFVLPGITYVDAPSVDPAITIKELSMDPMKCTGQE